MRNKPKADFSSLTHRKIRRGFDVTGLGQAARKLLKEGDTAQSVGASLAHYAAKWTSPYDVYDDLPVMAPPSDEIPGGRWLKPHHLDPYVQTLASCLQSRVQLAFSTPPQHFKSVTTFVALAYLCVKFTGRDHIYITYNADMAHVKHQEFTKILDALQIAHQSQGPFTRFNGNKVSFFGKGSGAQGKPCNGLMIVDDPVADKAEARSPVERNSLWQKFTGDVLTRESIGGMSTVVMMTRYDPDDLVGRLIKLRPDPWQWINLKMVSDGPDDDPLRRDEGEYLLDVASIRRKGEQALAMDPYNYGAMYQGTPINKGARMFHNPQTYDVLPTTNFMSVWGIDGAYSGHGDWSVAVNLLEAPDGRLYLRRVVRMQSTLSEFGRALVTAINARPGPVMWLVGGQEEYTACEMLRAVGVKRLQTKRYESGKGSRETPCANAWNSGRLLVPVKQDDATVQLIDEVTNFTGNPKNKDDCVAALDGAFRLATKKIVTLAAGGRPLTDTPHFFETTGTAQLLKDYADKKRQMLRPSPVSTKLFSN